MKILAIESSCDETPVERLLAPEVYVLASQERIYGASRL
jgi:tRNA A37 threonylcarbamoyltransferase TsaD